MIAPSDSINYEAVKVSLRQNDKGFMLTLGIHPDDIPENLFRDFVGARYAVAMVRIGEDEKPFVRTKPNSYVQMSGILARDSAFQQWLVHTNQTSEYSEQSAVDVIHQVCDINSRSELATNASAQRLLINLKNKFDEWVKT
jgi:hypothetical protein